MPPQASAQQATADVTARKADLDAEAARYKELYDSLSEQERQAAEAAAEAAQRPPPPPLPRGRRRARPPPTARETARRSPPSRRPAAPPATGRRPPQPRSEEPAPAPRPAARAAAAAVAAALSKVGAAYVYGAAGPNSFDCSGLTSWAWAQAGVSIPRTSGGQAGLPSVPLSELQPGDLVTYYSPVSHVAMYIGNGQIIHASTESRPVYITTRQRWRPERQRSPRRAEPPDDPQSQLGSAQAEQIAGASDPSGRNRTGDLAVRGRTIGRRVGYPARAANAAGHQRLSAAGGWHPVLRPVSGRAAARRANWSSTRRHWAGDAEFDARSRSRSTGIPAR